MPYKMKVSESTAKATKYLSALTGQTECVAFVQQTAGCPNTAKWKPGIQVCKVASGAIEKYTAIATFVGGHYPTDGAGKHAAIYLSHDNNSIKVLDQWRDHPVAERPIKFAHADRRSNDGRFFFVIESQ